MQYQTFRGSDVNDALSAVRASLGEDALIQSTRHVTNGRKGGLGRRFVEIVAAPAGLKPRGRRSPFTSDIGSELPGRARGFEAPNRPSRSTARHNRGGRLDPASIEAELGALREMLEELSATRPPRERAQAMLHAAGIEGALAKDLARGATRAAKSGPSKLRAWLTQRLAERVLAQPSLIATPEPKVIACVGSTGVGKTTSLAKLAAQAHLDRGRRVGVISLDTFRVGAVDQWKRYAKLIGIPFGIAKDPASFHRLLADQRADLVLVDTAGRSLSDADSSNRLAACLETVDSHEVHVMLALPAWLRARDAERTLAAYSNPRPTEIVMTKLDETFQVGGVMHAALPTSIPFAYLCDGPRVPEDIHDAAADVIADAVLSEQP